MCITVNAKLDFVDGMAVSVVKENKDMYAIIVNGKIFRRGLRMKVSPKEIEEALTSLYINKESFNVFKYFAPTSKTTIKEEIKNKKILEDSKYSEKDLLNMTIDKKVGEKLKEEAELEQIDNEVKPVESHIHKVSFSDKDVYREEIDRIQQSYNRTTSSQERLIANFLKGQNLTMEELEKESEKIRRKYTPEQKPKQDEKEIEMISEKLNDCFNMEKEHCSSNEQIRSKLRKVNKVQNERPEMLSDLRTYNDRINEQRKESEPVKEKLNNIEIDDCDYITIKDTLKDIKDQAVNFTERVLVFGLDTLSRILA